VAHAMSAQSSGTRVEKAPEAAAVRMAEDLSAAPQPADSCKERRLCLESEFNLMFTSLV
ncbi:unnamed protein product, partial [Symbiodinium sp. CCMP2456]